MGTKRALIFFVGLSVAAAVAATLIFGVVYRGSNDTAGFSATAAKTGDQLATATALSRQPRDGTTPFARDSGGASEGIKVHGHWTIEIRDPDGSLVSHREFDNALDSNGSRAISIFLARVRTVGLWTISLSSDTVQNRPCVTSSGSSTSCVIIESPSQQDLNQLFKNLVLDVPGSGTNVSKFVLSGTATAQKPPTREKLPPVMAVAGSLGS